MLLKKLILCHILPVAKRLGKYIVHWVRVDLEVMAINMWVHTSQTSNNKSLTIKCSLVSYPEYWDCVSFYNNVYQHQNRDVSTFFMHHALTAWIYPTPPHQAGGEARSIFEKIITNLNIELFFTGCLTKNREVSIPYNLSSARERIDGFMPFPRISAQSERQMASSRVWTQVADSISYDNNCYISGIHCNYSDIACIMSIVHEI